MPRLLLVQPDPVLQRTLGRLLGGEGCFCTLAMDAPDACRALAAGAFDLVIVDVSPARRGALDALCEIRQAHHTPILALAPPDQAVDAVLALERGADDCLRSPWDDRELMARVRALLRRADTYSRSPAEAHRLHFDTFDLDLDRHDAIRDEVPLRLTRREFELLHLFARHSGKALATRWIFETLWGFGPEFGTKTLTVAIGRLRRKLELDPTEPRLLLSVRGYGYKLAASPLLQAARAAAEVIPEAAGAQAARVGRPPDLNLLGGAHLPGTSRAHLAQSSERLLSRYAATTDPRLRDEFIEGHRELVRSVAGRFTRPGVPLDDLMQTAWIALIKAVDRFDPEAHVQFSTYAVSCIIGEIKRYFRDRTWSLKVPRQMQELSGRLVRAREVLAIQLQRSPTVPELAEALAVSEEQVLEAMELQHAYQAGNLDEPCQGKDGQPAQSLADCIGSVDAEIEGLSQRAPMAAALAGLGQRDRQIIQRRFFDDWTQDQVATELNLSQMQVSRLERAALRQLRELLPELSGTRR